MEDIRKNTFTNYFAKSNLFISLVLSIMSTVAFYMMFVFWLFPNTYFSVIFSQRGSIPYSTTLLCFWGLLLLLFSWFRLKKEQKTFLEISKFLLGLEKIDKDIAEDNLKLIKDIKNKFKGDIVSNRFLRSMHRIKDGVKQKSELADLLRDQAETDTEILRNTHATIKFIIWFIPILGFIGTIIGISGAISGFSALIQTSSDFASVKDSLGNVAQNLGVAFETTLLALIKTSILMLFFSMIQKNETSYLIHMDEFCSDNLMELLVPLPQAREDKSQIALLTESIENLTDKILIWDPKFSGTLDSFFSRLKDQLDQVSKNGTAAAEKMVNSTQLLHDSASKLTNLGDTVRESVQALTTLDEFNRCLDSLSESVSQLPSVLHEMKKPHQIRIVEIIEGEK